MSSSTRTTPEALPHFLAFPRFVQADHDGLMAVHVMDGECGEVSCDEHAEDAEDWDDVEFLTSEEYETRVGDGGLFASRRWRRPWGGVNGTSWLDR